MSMMNAPKAKGSAKNVNMKMTPQDNKAHVDKTKPVGGQQTPSTNAKATGATKKVINNNSKLANFNVAKKGK